MTKEKQSTKAYVIVFCVPVLALIFTLLVLVTGSGASLLFAVWLLAAA